MKKLEKEEVGEKVIEVEVKGISPLLMHRFNMMELTESKRRTGELNPDDKVEVALYKTPKGEIYLPATYFRGSLVEAGKQFQISGRRKNTYSALLGSALRIEPEAIICTNQIYEVDVKSGVNPSTKGRMIIKRPRFDSWGGKFKIIIEDEQLSSSKVKEILDYAGLRCGVGDWRPQKKGPYGKFQVILFKEV